MADTTSSFIPKNANKVKKPRTSKRIYIFSYISYVFFFGTLLVVLGTYVYAAQVSNALAEHKQMLTDERNEFTEGDLAEVRDLEKRIIIAERLIAESSAPSKIFTALESVVADTVRFSGFTYERLENNDFKLSLTGDADSFDSAVFQRDLMAAAPILSSATLSTYTYGSDEGEDNEDGTAQLEFVFEGSDSTTLFPYEPALEEFTEDEEENTETGSSIEESETPDEEPLIIDEVTN